MIDICLYHFNSGCLDLALGGSVSEQHSSVEATSPGLTPGPLTTFLDETERELFKSFGD